MKRINVIMILVFCGCTSKKVDCIVTTKDILNNNSMKVHAIYDSNKVIIGISDNDSISKKAGAYYFSDMGQLQSYKFFKTDSAYCYDEEYNESGQIIRQEGNQIVDENIREINLDSAYIRLYMFSLHRIYGDPEISINKQPTFSLKLEEDSLRSNIQTAAFGLNTKGLTNVIMYISVPCFNECTGKSEAVRDTISMIKNPRLNLTNN